MSATGELIRLMNYVDDITSTLRRISASIPTIEPEERKKLAEYLRGTSSGFSAVLEKLEKETK
jgi:hypothetical protein